jgi:hypothetical protein
MGRRPESDQAMTGAERQARYRERQAAMPAPRAARPRTGRAEPARRCHHGGSVPGVVRGSIPDVA